MTAFVFGGCSYSQTTPTTSVPSSSTSTTSTTTPAATGQNTVTIQNFSFSPSILTVKVGDKVTWTNQDSMGHSVTADDKSFDTGVMANGESKSLTFAKAGSFAYHCSVHPSMMGTVVVQ